ncbi:Mitochondrial carrier [Mycena venus]|uniref:Mitochondrial carrier n=1 Tax=Mycena venus TaxID=2733690 RepID=A0A8H7CGP9_9AGAR|nr:Mitochondrial carrier [Mycena venus]
MFFFLDTVFSVPFNSVLVRYRAASHPKASVEDGSISPPPTFISMAKRVWRLQGTEGLTRGLMPTLGATLFYTMFWPFWWFKLYLSPSASISMRVSLVSSLISTLIYTMFLVTTYRAITSPRKLDILNAREALHILFSAHERKKPWAIFQIPGLLPAMVLNFGFYHFIIRPMGTVILPWRWPQDFSPIEYALRYAGLVCLAFLSTVVCAPLEVIVTRLALQRNYGGHAFVDDSVAAAHDDVESTARETPVVQPAVTSSPVVVPVYTSPEAQIPPPVKPEPSSEKVAFPDEKPVEPTPVDAQPLETAPSSAPHEVDLERGPLSIDSDDIVVHLRSENDPYLGAR